MAEEEFGVWEKALEAEFPMLFPRKTPCGIWIGDGWREPVKELCTKLRDLIDEAELIPFESAYLKRDPDVDWKFQVDQIKEKFGGLRFYYSANVSKEVRKEVDRLVAEAEASCDKLCEQCGELGTRASPQGWISVMCTKHWGEYNARFEDDE